MLHQLVENLQVAVQAGHAKRRLAEIIILGVHVSSNTQKPTDLRQDVLFNRVEQLGVDDTTIMKIGRWSGLTFVTYIHTQIGALNFGLAQRMAIRVHFINVAAVLAG
jgi:hypothetical protein